MALAAAIILISVGKLFSYTLDIEICKPEVEIQFDQERHYDRERYAPEPVDRAQERTRDDIERMA